MGDVMAVGSPDFHFIKLAEVGEAVVLGAECGDLLELQFAFQGDEHFQAARTGQAVEVVRSGEAGGGGDAVGLDEVTAGLAVF